MGNGAVSRPQRYGLALCLLAWFLCGCLADSIGALGPIRRSILPGSLYASSAGLSGMPSPKNILAFSIPSSCGRGFSCHARVKILSLYSTSHSALPASPVLNLPHPGFTHCVSAQPVAETKYIWLPPVNMLGQLAHRFDSGSSHPALGKEELISISSNANRSVSSFPQVTMVTRCPANGLRALTNSASPFWSSRHLGPWIRSPSSRSLNFLDAVSKRVSSASAFLLTASALSLSEPTICRACSSCLSSRMKALPSNTTSPAMPKTTRIGPMEWINAFRNTQRSNEFDLPRRYFTPSRVSSLILAQYSITAPRVRIAAATTAAHWTTVRLPHNLDRKDHEGAELAATVRIWLIIFGGWAT